MYHRNRPAYSVFNEQNCVTYTLTINRIKRFYDSFYGNLCIISKMEQFYGKLKSLSCKCTIKSSFAIK